MEETEREGRERERVYIIYVYTCMRSTHASLNFHVINVCLGRVNIRYRTFLDNCNFRVKITLVLHYTDPKTCRNMTLFECIFKKQVNVFSNDFSLIYFLL